MKLYLTNNYFLNEFQKIEQKKQFDEWTNVYTKIKEIPENQFNSSSCEIIDNRILKVTEQINVMQNLKQSPIKSLSNDFKQEKRIDELYNLHTISANQGGTSVGDIKNKFPKISAITNLNENDNNEF